MGIVSWSRNEAADEEKNKRLDSEDCVAKVSRERGLSREVSVVHVQKQVEMTVRGPARS